MPQCHNSRSKINYVNNTNALQNNSNYLHELSVWLQPLISLLCAHLSLGMVDWVVAQVAEVSEYVVERLGTNIRMTTF